MLVSPHSPAQPGSLCLCAGGCLAALVVLLTSQESVACPHVCGSHTHTHSRGLYTLEPVSILKKSKVEGKESLNSLLFLYEDHLCPVKSKLPLLPTKTVILETDSSS